MAPLAGVPVELGREAAVGFGRNDRLDLCAGQRLAQPVRVACPIREELFAGQPLDQRRRAAQVVPRRSWACPGSSLKSVRLPNASAKAMILVVIPPRERPMAWL